MPFLSRDIYSGGYFLGGGNFLQNLKKGEKGRKEEGKEMIFQGGHNKYLPSNHVIFSQAHFLW